MRSFYKSITILILIVVSHGCMEDIESTRQDVAIRFTLPEFQNTDLPADTRLFVGVRSRRGDPVLEMEEVGFAVSENGFATVPLQLPSGTYTITDFMLMNQQEEVIFAVPTKDGALSTTIEKSLEYDFQITPGNRPGISLDLLSTKDRKPGDFGYASFKKPGRKLAITVSMEGSTDLTTANAHIINGSDTVAVYSLLAKINHVNLPYVIAEDVKLVVSKTGYAPAQFSLLEVLRSLQKRTLKVVLKEARAFSMLAYMDLNSSSEFQFSLGGPEGTSVTIDWGDGTTESHGLGASLDLTHTYTRNGNYPVSITGDIDKIVSFYSFYGQGMIDSIDLQYLTDLSEIRFGLTRSPRVLDLSHNTKLEFALLAALNELETLYLPKEHKINWLMLDGNDLSTAMMDTLINNIYQNTVNKNIMNGQLSLGAVLYDEGTPLVGPPSAAALEQLRGLRDNYGWALYPDPFSSALTVANN